jgi:two-component system LytT family response regulator
MKHIRTAIIDDEPAAVEVIRELSAQLASDIIIEAVAMNGIDALQVIIQHKPDLVFLDVNMPFLSGIQVIEKLASRDCKIIFTTGTADYALKALKLQAVDYLLKPVDPADFLLAVEKVRHLLSGKKPATALTHGSKIQFPTQHGITYLDESEIVQVIGMGSYCRIVTTDKAGTLTVSRNIGSIESRLPDYFFRCHNSHIINLNFVSSFSTKEGFCVILKDGSKVEVSRRSKDKLLERLSEAERWRG